MSLSPLSRHQAGFLEGFAALGLTKDSALAAELSELGEQTDRTTLVRWRAGDRRAPLGLLWVLLRHLRDAEERAQVLNLIAKPFGLRVVIDEQATEKAAPVEVALDVASLAGSIVELARASGADGKIDRQEADAFAQAAGALEDAAAALRTITPTPARRVG